MTAVNFWNRKASIFQSLLQCFFFHSFSFFNNVSGMEISFDKIISCEQATSAVGGDAFTACQLQDLNRTTSKVRHV